MIIQCPKCKKQYNVDGDRITEKGVKITCPACQHQFIARRRGEEKEKKPPVKQAKTPPCIICGQPSTHVLRGPPPRPLCEYHFNVEKEKETRFWEAAEGYMPRGIEMSPPTVPGGEHGKTVSPAAGRRQGEPGGAPARADVPRPPEPGPAFESFDDFDFFDEAAKPSSPKPPPSPPPPAAEEPGERSFDFDEQAFARPEEERPADSFSEPSSVPPQKETPAPPSAGPAFEDFDSAFPLSSPPPARAVGPPGTMGGEPAAVPFHHEAEAAPQVDPGLAAELKKRRTYLDGTPAEEKYSDFDELEASFEWKPPSASPAPAPPTLEEEVGEPLELAVPRKPALAAVKKTEPLLKPVKLLPPRGRKAAVAVLAVELGALIVAGFLSVFNVLGRASGAAPSWEPDFVPWQGELRPAKGEQGSESAGWITSTAQARAREEREKQRQAAQEQYQQAWKLMLRDTAEAYAAAQTAIEAALMVEPSNPDFLALKIHLLAFRESLDREGQTSLASSETEDFYTTVPASLEQEPALRRAKAHLFLSSDPGEARVMLEEYLAARPDDPLGYYLLGQSFRFQRNPNLALAAGHLKRAVSLEPDFIRGRWELAKVYETLDRGAEALAEYKEISRRAADRKGVQEEIGRLSQPPEKISSPSSSSPSGATTPPGHKSPALPGVRSTGSEISQNITEIITTVEQYLRRYKERVPDTPVRPRPPEEAP